MKFTKEIIQTIKEYLLGNVTDHPNDLIPHTMDHFGFSRPTVSKYLKELIDEGKITRNGGGPKPEYSLAAKQLIRKYPLDGSWTEDQIWNDLFSGMIQDMSENFLHILQYGFTEMVNNAIDHAQGSEIEVHVHQDARSLRVSLKDDGVGIFHKIQNVLHLDHPNQAILELVKGKFTSDPANHTGEGIFFTSKAMDRFAIQSGDLTFYGNFQGRDWLLPDQETIDGTRVIFELYFETETQIDKIFDEFTTWEKHPGFHKTIIPIKVMEMEGSMLISRSQAKRLIQRFDRFLEVILDFDGITTLGQGFADQVFRIFNREHPEVKLLPINLAPGVKKMILRANPRILDNE